MTPRQAAGLAVILAATTLIFLSAGLGDAYIAADDFQWLGGGHTFTWARLQYVTGGDRFYRPMADLWFAGATRACGFSLPCHHTLLLGIHLVNITLIYLLGAWLFASTRTVWLATLLFAFNPAYTHAVVWLSAITGVLCAFGFVGSLTALARSWRIGRAGQRHALELVAVMLFAVAAFSHEAAITLPAVAAAMWFLFGPPDRTRPVPLFGSIVVVLAFVAATVMANRNNALFEQSGYALGPHMFDHALDYIASLYVGPSTTSAHIAIVGALLGLLFINRTTAFGVIWLVVTMAPYLPFTAGNTSRYAYLPAIGFSVAAAGAIVAAVDRLRQSSRVPSRAADLVYAIAVLFVVVRFAPFAHASIRGHVRAFEEWRGWTRTLANGAEVRDGFLRLRAPDDPAVDRMYVEPMVRWELRDYTTPLSR